MNAIKKVADYKKAKNKALELLQYLGYKKPCVKVTEICEELGIKICFKRFVDENISGFFYPDEGSIYVNSNDEGKRQNFTIAHELAHKLLHEEWAKTNDYKILFRDSGLTTKDWREQEANCFAANLLVPKFMLDKYYEIASEEELSTLFVVSKAVIRNRINTEYNQ